MKVLGIDPSINRRRVDLSPFVTRPQIYSLTVEKDSFQRRPMTSQPALRFGRDLNSIIEAGRKRNQLTPEQQQILVSQARAEGFLRMPTDVAEMIMTPKLLSKVIKAATDSHRILPAKQHGYDNPAQIWLANTLHRPLTLPTVVPDVPLTDKLKLNAAQEERLKPWMHTILTLLTSPSVTYHVQGGVIPLQTLTPEQQEFLKGFTTMAHYLGHHFVYETRMNWDEKPDAAHLRNTIQRIQVAHALGLADAVYLPQHDALHSLCITSDEIRQLRSAVDIPLITNTSEFDKTTDRIKNRRNGFAAVMSPPLEVMENFKSIHQHPLGAAWYQAEQNKSIMPLIAISPLTPPGKSMFAPSISEQADFLAHVFSGTGRQLPLLSTGSHTLDYATVTNALTLRYGTPQLQQVLSHLGEHERPQSPMHEWIRHPDVTFDTIMAAKAHGVLNGGEHRWTYWSADHKSVAWAIENPSFPGTVLIAMNISDPEMTKTSSTLAIPPQFLQDKNLKTGHALILNDIRGIRVAGNVFKPDIEHPIALAPSQVALYYFDAAAHAYP